MALKWTLFAHIQTDTEPLAQMLDALMSRRAWGLLARICVFPHSVLPSGRAGWGPQIHTSDAASSVVRPGETTPSADLGGSSKYSNENFED